MLVDKIRVSFNNYLPSTTFDVGYIAKRGNGKRWILKEADLQSMYKQFDVCDTITLFCEYSQPSSSSPTDTRKRKSAYDDHELEVKRIALDLSKNHSDKYNEQQLRLWARMVVNGQHSDLEEPPNIPLLTGTSKKNPKKESITDALTGAATAFAKALSSPNTNTNVCTSTNTGPDISPQSKAQLRGMYISQLKDLQTLRESGVLTDEEFKEQKDMALESIRKMN